MFKNLIIKYKNFNNIKFRFDLPPKKKIIQYDELHFLVFKKIFKVDFNVIPTRKKDIYFWIFLKQILYFDFTFKTYITNFAKFTQAKIFITQIDNDIVFYKLKNLIKDVHFISIQNGNRMQQYTSMFRYYKYNKSQKLTCDHIFVFNKYYIKKYQSSINSKFHVLGNFKNNMVEINKTKFKGSFLYISHYHKGYEYRDTIIKSLNLIDLYFLKNDKKINILLRSKNYIDQKKEIDYYNKIFKSVCLFHKSNSWHKSYKILDKFENIIFSDSHLGYEAISRKKKVAILPLNKKDRFGWPAPFKKNYNFFCAKKLTYFETKRVLNNVFHCNENDWNKKYYTNIKDLAYFDKNNSKLKKVIFNLL